MKEQTGIQAQALAVPCEPLKALLLTLYSVALRLPIAIQLALSETAYSDPSDHHNPPLLPFLVASQIVSQYHPFYLLTELATMI